MTSEEQELLSWKLYDKLSELATACVNACDDTLSEEKRREARKLITDNLDNHQCDHWEALVVGDGEIYELLKEPNDMSEETGPNNGETQEEVQPVKKRCLVQGCGRISSKSHRGMCQRHYKMAKLEVDQGRTTWLELADLGLAIHKRDYGKYGEPVPIIDIIERLRKEKADAAQQPSQDPPQEGVVD